jgi:hypothetical protein
MPRWWRCLVSAEICACRIWWVSGREATGVPSVGLVCPVRVWRGVRGELGADVARTPCHSGLIAADRVGCGPRPDFGRDLASIIPAGR